MIGGIETWRWLLAMVLPAMPLAVAAPLLRWLGSSEGVEWAYSLWSTTHPLNFGGNPSEVLSHLLNWILMSACTGGLCVTLIALVLLSNDPNWSPRHTILSVFVACLTLSVVLAWAIDLDSKHGEGAVGVSFLFLFCPCTALSAVTSRRLLSGRSRLALRIGLIAAVFPLAVILQWFYQVSDSGGPNILAFPLLFGQAVLWWLLGRRFHRQPSQPSEGSNFESRC